MMAAQFLFSLVFTLLYRSWMDEPSEMNRREVAGAVVMLAAVAASAVAFTASANPRRAGDIMIGFAIAAGMFGGFVIDDARRRHLGLDERAPAGVPIEDD